MLKDYVLAVISLRALHLKKMNMNFMFKSINFQKLSYQFDLFFPALLLKKIACQTVLSWDGPQKIIEYDAVRFLYFLPA